MAITGVTLLILDGLRPDAIRADVMPSLHRLEQRSWRPLAGSTIRPSVTVAALVSLATGVSPALHGLTEPGFPSLGLLRRSHPMPSHLRRHGRATTVVTSRLPAPNAILARLLLSVAGISGFRATGATPAATARAVIAERRTGRAQLTIVYLDQCDRAGHGYGWMSPEYLTAANAVDDAVAMLGDPPDEENPLVIVADHGGGGVLPTDHDIPHPINDAIPIVISGPGILPRRSAAPASLLDIPPTILHLLDVPIPASYEGRVLHEAFSAEISVAA